MIKPYTYSHYTCEVRNFADFGAGSSYLGMLSYRTTGWPSRIGSRLRAFLFVVLKETSGSDQLGHVEAVGVPSRHGDPQIPLVKKQ